MKVTLVETSCRGGCGKRIHTTTKSIMGADVLHKKYAGYCADCLPITEDELTRLQGEEIIRNWRNAR